jgi:hypothetical protein
LAPSRARLRAANGTSFVTAGTVSFVASIDGGPRVAITAIVTPDLASPTLVGWRDLRRLGVLPHTFPGLCHDVLGQDGGWDDDGDPYG